MYEVVGDEVFRVTEISTSLQNAVVKEFHDYFFKVKLTYASEKKEVIASVFNYLDEPQTDFEELIIFEYDGHTIEAKAVKGTATITFEATVSGNHVIKTVNPRMRNGEVTIVVE